MTRGSQIAQKARRPVNLKFRTPTTPTTRFLFIASSAALIIFSAGALVTTRYLNSFDTFDTSDTSGTASILGETATPTPTPETETEEKEDVLIDANSFTVQTARDEDITLVPSGGAGQVIIRSSTTTFYIFLPALLRLNASR